MSKKITLVLGLSIGLAFVGGVSYAQSGVEMKLTVPGFANGAAIPAEYAFCIPSNQAHVQNGPNRNPQLLWSDLPAKTLSLAIIMVDPNVPVAEDKMNKAGVIIPGNAPRRDFYHWVLVDIPPNLHEIKAGQDSNGVTARGKAPGPTAYGVRGINDFTPAFAGDKNMAGQYGGYDGPCPPWNDELLHHYHFHLYALDVDTLGLKGQFDAKAAIAAMQGHILQEKEWVGVYSLNPSVPGSDSRPSY